MRREQRDERNDEAMRRVEAGETVTEVAADLDLTREHLSRLLRRRRAAVHASTRFVLGFAVTA